MQPGQEVRTFTGRRGTFAGVLRLSHQATPHRIKVRLALRPDGGPPITAICLYRPADVTAADDDDTPAGDDCPDHGPYAGDDCPKC